MNSLLSKKDSIVNGLEQQVTRANREYHDRIAEKYDHDPRVWLGVMHPNVLKRFISELKRHFRGQTNLSFLNLGCGSGNHLHIRESSIVSITGLDISFGMLSLAKSKFTTKTANPFMVQGDGLVLPFKECSFDCVYSFAVLHHVYNHVHLFSEIMRVLKPSGLLYVDYEPNRGFMTTIKRNLLLNGLFECYRFLAKRSLGIEENPDLKSVMQLAEYHVETTPGLDCTKLTADLHEAGFTNGRVIPHSDGLDLLFPRKGRLLVKVIEMLLSAAGVRDYRNRAKTFALLAVKEQAL